MKKHQKITIIGLGKKVRKVTASHLIDDSEWLSVVLQHGCRLLAEVRVLSDACSISTKRLYAARDHLCVLSELRGRHIVWSLPPMATV
jgi:hypothetical protein